MWKFREILTIFILGLITIPNNCDGRAVNISNTWTLPHDGFSVFYRFFRDQISWFEADAVCQFHHANLVTVDSSSEFDAAREFLRVLDVTETVWIGLMRPQNSERFTWSNSKPLTITSENWAESLPVIDAPLCAVIDPIRDYRWHALRCGGPETASFLCEMNVPSWAEECVLRDIPSLTIQYMADSGTVEITKDCGIDEGTIHQVCRGKQDRAIIMKKLVCKNEQEKQKKIHFTENPISSPNINNMRTKTLSKIINISSDNNEDNNINIQQKIQSQQQQQTENPVQKLIEQFNVEELMQSDQPLPSVSSQLKSSIINNNDEIPKPIKKQINKKVNSKYDKKIKINKKNQPLPQLKGKNIALEDMMMGDQPINNDNEQLSSSQSLDNDDINEIQLPLPHTKKSLLSDLKHHENVYNEREHLKLLTTTENLLKLSSVVTLSTNNNIDTTIINNNNNNNNNKDDIIETNLSTTKESIDNESGTVTANDNFITEKTSTEFDIATGTTNNLLTTAISLPINVITTEKSLLPSTIGHPMHPQQPRNNIFVEEINNGHQQQHIIETNDNNHFIPPMLMVKSHYTPPKTNHNNEQQQIDLKLNLSENVDKLELINENNKNFDDTITTTLSEIVDDLNKDKNNPTENFNDITTIKSILNSDINKTNIDITTKSTHLISDNLEISSDKLTTIQQSTSPSTISSIDLTTTGPLKPTNGHQVVEIKIGNSDNPTTFSITTRADIPQQQQNLETTKSITTDSDAMIEITTKIPEQQQQQQQNDNEQITNNNDESTTLINNKNEMTNDDLIAPTITTSSSLNQLQEIIEITGTANKITSSPSSPSSPSSLVVNNFSSFTDDKSTFTETTEQDIKTFSNIRRTETDTETTTTATGTATKIIPSTTTLEHHPTKVKQQNEYKNNDDNIEIYKPNRRRSLTKPENTSYLKKILG